MPIIPLSTFKQVRKNQGSIYSMYVMLDKAGLCEQQTDRAVDAIVSDLGIRFVEKMKSKDLYDTLDGFLLGCQEFNLAH
jgi:hypothetical protein